eukprot:TRINITY_DN1913_c0_g1_i1.p3 TRINITY_DN1913_c0_g1~~TRINITY_DN1913_c0_g1_i1.p3  ORF type:complete len:63 (+),score=10.32 TRINITY_DN1913_c0_g1_i1:86-274(+)
MWFGVTEEGVVRFKTVEDATSLECPILLVMAEGDAEVEARGFETNCGVIVPPGTLGCTPKDA